MTSQLDPFDVSRLGVNRFAARVEYHPSLTSTNDRARHIAADGQCGLPVVVVADEQTAGRGRGTNRWWTGRGSLALSLLFDPATLGIERRTSPQVALAAAVAIVDTIATCLPPESVGLHWPNDVFAMGRKLAGILVEALVDGRHILGIGLNANNSIADAPPELQPSATSLVDLTGRTHDRTALFLTLLAELKRTLEQLGAGSAALGRRYDELCLQRGRILTIQIGDRTTSGRCAGIAPDGALLLDTRAGREKFYGGVLLRTKDDK